MSLYSKKERLDYRYLVLLLLWVFTGGSVIAVMFRNELLAAFFLFLSVLIFIRKNKIRPILIKSFASTLSIIFLSIIINYFFSIKPQDFKKYIYIFLVFFTQGVFCLFLFSQFTYSNFLLHFYAILRFIRSHALVNAIIVTLLPSLLFQHVSNEFSAYAGDTFFYIFNRRADQYAFNLLGLSLIRNQGFFWEPGVLQFYLNLLLFFQLYVVKAKRRELLLTIIAIISTYSTTAYVIMLIVFSLFFVEMIRKSPTNLIIFLLLGFGILFPLFSANMQNKLQGENQVSAYVRFYDFLQQLIVIRDNFFVGIGLDDQRYAELRGLYKLPQSILDYMGISPENKGSSNSIFFLLGTLGVPIGGLWIYSYINQVFIRQKKVLVSILLILSVMVEPLLLKPFFVTFIFSGLMVIIHRRASKQKNANSLWLPGI